MKHALGLCLVVVLAGCHEKTPPPANPPAVKNEPKSDPKPVQDSDPNFQLDLADLYLKHKKYDDAMRIYQEIQKSSKEVDLVGRATYGVALVHYVRGEFKLAIGPLISAIQTTPAANRAEMKFFLVGLHLEVGNESAAEEVLDGMLREPDQTPQVRSQVYNRLAELYARKNNLAGFAAKIEKMAEQNPKNAELWIVLGQLYSSQLADPAKALAVCEKLLLLAPDDAGALQAILESAARASKPERALEALEKLLKLVEKDTAAQVRALKLAGSLFLQARAWEKAAGVLERAEKLVTTLAERDDVRMGLYSAWKELGQLPARVQALEKLVTDDPKDEAALRGLLLIHQRFDGAIAKADEALGMLLQLKPEEPAYLAAGADIAKQKGDHERLVGYYEKLLVVDPRTASGLMDAYLNALKLTGKLDRAMPELQKAADKDATLKVAFLAQSGELLLRAGRREDTVKLWERMRAAVREAKRPADYLTAVVVLRRNGAVNEATEMCMEALRLSADAPTLANLLLEGAELMDAQKKPEEADKLLREILRRPEFSEEARRAAQKKLAELQQKYGKK